MTARKSYSGRSDEATRLKETRTEQLAQIRNAIAVIEPHLQEAVGSQKKQLKLLDSVSLGLYEEIDKLSKKAPAEPVTDLVLAQMNEVIRETKELITDDPYVQRLQEFVPAGDNPQHRDAVVVLRQVRQGLDRFRQQLDSLANKLKDSLMNAKGIERALQLNLDGNELITEKDLEDYHTTVSRSWLTTRYPHEFDFSKLDRTNIVAYFGDTQ
ncbi:MAG: hypothetical protein ACYTX0_30205 [Nostoc sp.]